jgi:hypothetical protein
MYIRLKGAEVSIGSANNVASATTVRVINTGTAAVLNLSYANGSVYANTTVASGEAVVIVKGPDDLLTGANMKGAPVEYRG